MVYANIEAVIFTILTYIRLEVITRIRHQYYTVYAALYCDRKCGVYHRSSKAKLSLAILKHDNDTDYIYVFSPRISILHRGSLDTEWIYNGVRRRGGCTEHLFTQIR